jgi:hypothetical protein
MFQGGQQHDSQVQRVLKCSSTMIFTIPQELLLLLIDCLVDSISHAPPASAAGSGSRATTPPASATPAAGSPCADIFAGTSCGMAPFFCNRFHALHDASFEGVVTCGSCGYKSNMKEVFTVLSLSLAGQQQQQQQQQPKSERHNITAPPPVASSSPSTPPSPPSSQAVLPPAPPPSKTDSSKGPLGWFKNMCRSQLPFLFSDFSMLRSVNRELR